jgi:hypothetical protein
MGLTREARPIEGRAWEAISEAARRGGWGRHGNISELLAAARAAEHQPAAAHISPAGKFGGEEKPLAKNLQQRFDIFGGSDAAKENDLAVASHPRGDETRIALERDAVALLGHSHGRGRDGTQRLSGYGHLGREQATAGRNHQHPGRIGGRLGKGLGIRELAAEIESADKGEGFAKSQAAVPEPQRQGEAGAVAKDELGANSAGISRREQKNALKRRWREGG